MDTTVTKGRGSKSLGSVAVAPEKRLTVHPGPRKLCHTQGAVLSWAVARKVLVLLSVVPIAILSLSLSGCRLVGGTEPTEAPVASTSGPGALRNVAPAAGTTQQLAKSSVAMPTPPQRAPEVKRPAAATASRGAEKLVTQSSPALPRSKETISQPAQTRPASAPSTAEVVSGAGGTVKELVVKGPPRARQSRSAGRNGRLWLGFGFGSAIVGLGALIFLKRRHQSSTPVKTDKEELVMPKEFLLKEPAPAPKWNMTLD